MLDPRSTCPQAFYSVKPATAFFRDDIEATRAAYDVYEFIQEAGDLVYVVHETAVVC